MTKDTKWPPEGAMGPIFSEYLFIRFFCRDGEKSINASVYWPESKFHELLLQIYHYVNPEVDLIKSGKVCKIYHISYREVKCAYFVI